MPTVCNRKLPPGVAAGLAALLLAACSGGDGRSPADRVAARHGVADLVFFNGTVLTMDPRMPEVRAIAIREGRILALGEDADIEPLTNAGTRLEDLEGKTLMPGLLDPRDPDTGRTAPRCIEPLPDGGELVPSGDQPREHDPARHLREGVVALRLPTVPVDALPALLAAERAHPSPLHLRVAHWPACGSTQRTLLQQIMRELAQAPSADGGSLRVALDPEPAIVEPAPLPPAEGALPAAPSSVVATAADGEPAIPAAVVPTVQIEVPPSPWDVMGTAMQQGAASGESHALSALRSFTVDAAQAMGLAQESGMLAPGKRADLVVLDRDPSREAPARVAGTVVLQTWFGGELVYERGVQEAP